MGERQLLSHSTKEKKTVMIGNYIGISLFSIPSKMYSKILFEKSTMTAKDKISEEQEESNTGTGCADQIISMKIIIEKMFAKHSLPWPSPQRNSKEKVPQYAFLSSDVLKLTMD